MRAFPYYISLRLKPVLGKMDIAEQSFHHKLNDQNKMKYDLELARLKLPQISAHYLLRLSDLSKLHIKLLASKLDQH